MEFNFVKEYSHAEVDDDGDIDYEYNPFLRNEMTVTKSMRVEDVKNSMIQDMGLQE